MGQPGPVVGVGLDLGQQCDAVIPTEEDAVKGQAVVHSPQAALVPPCGEEGQGRR